MVWCPATKLCPARASTTWMRQPSRWSGDISRWISLSRDVFRDPRWPTLFGIHESPVYFERQTQFCNIPWPRERSAGTRLDSTQPVADRVEVANKYLGRAAHGRIVVLLTARAPSRCGQLCRAGRQRADIHAGRMPERRSSLSASSTSPTHSDPSAMFTHCGRTRMCRTASRVMPRRRSSPRSNGSPRGSEIGSWGRRSGSPPKWRPTTRITSAATS
jgi:hypothetical protein